MIIKIQIPGPGVQSTGAKSQEAAFLASILPDSYSSVTCALRNSVQSIRTTAWLFFQIFVPRVNVGNLTLGSENWQALLKTATVQKNSRYLKRACLVVSSQPPGQSFCSSTGRCLFPQSPRLAEKRQLNQISKEHLGRPFWLFLEIYLKCAWTLHLGRNHLVDVFT